MDYELEIMSYLQDERAHHSAGILCVCFAHYKEIEVLASKAA
jgi:hypothetical protein